MGSGVMENLQKDMQKNRKNLQKTITEPIVKLLVYLHISPNFISCFGFLLTLVGCVLIIGQQLLCAAIIVLIAAAFDMLDGGVARATGKVSKHGEFLDSTLDRISEGALFISLIISYNMQGDFTLIVALAAVALLVSLLVSYLRAKSEALSLPRTVGFFTRPERIITLTLGLALGYFMLEILALALAVIAICSFITAIQRAVYIWKNL